MTSLEVIAQLLDTLGLGTYDELDANANTIYLLDTPADSTDVWGVHPSSGVAVNPGVTKLAHSNYEKAVRIFYKGTKARFNSYNRAKTALLALSDYGPDSDINYIRVEQSEPSELGKNDNDLYEFSFVMTVYFKANV